ncbi:MAG: exonuclease domain-containing protein [Quisquiliibacterium sp.]
MRWPAIDSGSAAGGTSRRRGAGLASMRDNAATRAIFIGACLAVALVIGWLAASVAIVQAALEPSSRAAIWQLLAPQMPILVLALVLLILLAAVVANALYQRLVRAPARLIEQARALVESLDDQELAEDADPRQSDLVGTINALLRQRNQWRRDVQRQVDVAAHKFVQERNRLAALMSELGQGVLACNLDGRVILYNKRARLQFRSLSDAPSLADGAELLGVGKSIHAVLDRRLIAHALANVMQRLRRGAEHPVASFVTITPTGQSVRVHLAPVPDTTRDDPRANSPSPAGVSDDAQQNPASEAGEPGIMGYVLLIENVTAEFERHRAREQLMTELIGNLGDCVASLRRAAQHLGGGSEGGTADAARDAGVAQVIKEETRRIEDAVASVSAAREKEIGAHWPLEEMLGVELLQAARHRMLQAGASATIIEPPTQIWLKADSFALLQAIEALAARLVAERDAASVELRLSCDERQAHLDLCWSQADCADQTPAHWDDTPIDAGHSPVPVTVRDVLARHRGGFGYHVVPDAGRACLRLSLPMPSSGPSLEPGVFLHSQSRPEFYDFDLFESGALASGLDELPLAKLSYTVFDTETTGLAPSAGDEIIQIGAVRIVNGRLLRAESFEQLVDPRRPIPSATIPIHGIEPAMLVGKPSIEQVLPAFHAYSQDTVLVAHNAAFDMRFLELKQQSAGVEFSQPVLDTLLLSVLAQPQQDSHRLEAIADRFGIPVIGRHTALGDAILTAEVLLRLIPLLAVRGIHTLAQARAESRKTWYARLRY